MMVALAMPPSGWPIAMAPPLRALVSAGLTTRNTAQAIGANGSAMRID